MIRNPHVTLEEMLPNSKPWQRNLSIIAVTLVFLCLIFSIIYTSYNVYGGRRGNSSSPFFTYTFDRTEVYYFDDDEKPSTLPSPTTTIARFGMSGKVISRTRAPHSIANISVLT